MVDEVQQWGQVQQLIRHSVRVNNQKLYKIYYKIIVMGGKIGIILFLALLQITHSIYLRPNSQHTQAEKQLTALKDQQTAFEKQVIAIIDDIKNIELKFSSTSNTDQKVIVLEKAILSQRQQIYKLQNSIIPPFNLSKSACLELSSDQKNRMLEQLQKAKDQVAKLKAIAGKMPNNAQVIGILSDVSKQDNLIDSIQKVIYTKCEIPVVITPTIFQTNLYGTKWILGNILIETVVQEYYRRSRLYNNVTNCPVQSPYYDGSKCTKCDQPFPIFNIQTLKCDKCPFDTNINTDKHICEQIKHFTEYTNIANYMLDGASLPAKVEGNTPCSPPTPFFNGVCVACTLPSYWNVKQNKCKDCTAGQLFDVNTKTCAIPSASSLTYLQGNSRWVTSVGNLATVLKQRVDLIASKPNQFKICESNSPYFNSFSCISCPNEFSLADKTCVTAPPGLVYDPNLHAYVTAQIGKDTNTNAPNIISPSALPAAKNPCDIKTPYFDGITCITCAEPFTLFDTTSKKCVRCQAQEFYDKIVFQCIKRTPVYISSNFNNLVGNSRTDFAAYKAEVLGKLKNYGETIIKKCNADEYSDYNNCIKCNPDQKFNVQTKKCDICKGTVDPVTLICQPLKTLLTDLEAKNLIFGKNSNMNTYVQAQKKVVGPTLKCSSDKPYAVGGQNCILCNEASVPYFDLVSQKCIKCPQSLYFNSVSHNCEKEIFITNILGIKRPIEVESYTIVNLKAELQNLQKTRKTARCPETSPIASPLGDKCQSCDNNLGFYNLKTKQCVLGVYISNTAALKASGKAVESDKNTLAALQLANDAIKQPKVICKLQSPLFNGVQCISCAVQQYYNIEKKACSNAIMISNTDQIALQNNYIQKDENTLAKLILSNKKVPEPKRVCPTDQPLYNGVKCESCKQSLYDIEVMKCKNCAPGYIFDKNTHTCIKTPDFYPNLAKLSWIVNTDDGFDKLFALKKQRQLIPNSISCPEDKPHYNDIKKDCNSCDKDTFWNYQINSCMTCGVGQQVDPNTRKCGKKITGIHQTSLATKNILFDGNPKNQYVDKYNQNKGQYNTIQDCPSDKPYFDGFECIKCRPAIPYFSLFSNLCTNCPDNSIYDDKVKNCMSGNQAKASSPNLAKMYSSIF